MFSFAKELIHHIPPFNWALIHPLCGSNESHVRMSDNNYFWNWTDEFTSEMYDFAFIFHVCILKTSSVNLAWIIHIMQQNDFIHLNDITDDDWMYWMHKMCSMWGDETFCAKMYHISNILINLCFNWFKAWRGVLLFMGTRWCCWTCAVSWDDLTAQGIFNNLLCSILFGKMNPLKQDLWKPYF